MSDKTHKAVAAGPHCETCELAEDEVCDCAYVEGYEEGDIIIYGFDRASALRRWKKITGGKW